MDLLNKYSCDGFVYVDEPVVALENIETLKSEALEVVNGRYDTGVSPLRQWGSVDDGGLIKIDQAHLSNKVLSELVRNKNIARWASAVTRSNTIQVWATQLFYKPSCVKDSANVGWHTDSQYWNFWQGEVYTIWIALTESNALTGPLRFLQGSHLNPQINVGDALCADIDKQKNSLSNKQGITRQEISNPLPAGGISIHHANVYHASGKNVSGQPRLSLAIHVRTENAQLNKHVDSFGLCESLDDLESSPVVFLRA